MANPFQQRASEHQRSDSEFLSTLTPELFRIALDASHDPQRLLSKATVFSAPPGAGKTTMARFFQYTTLRRLQELIRRENDPTHRQLHEFAVERGLIRDGHVAVCGVRVSLERDYRELSMLGYSPERATDLLLSLLGARAVLMWKQMFGEANVPLRHVRVLPTVQGKARLDRMGAGDFEALAQRAAEVEALIYAATVGFIPPAEHQLLEQLGESFFPLLAIQAFAIEGQAEPLTPLLMLDDAHWIDKAQHAQLMEHLTLREVAMGRWVFQRMEALDVEDTLLWGAGVPSGEMTKRGRDFEDIRLTQALDEHRSAARKNFRRAAEQVSSRYISLMPELTRHGVRSLAALTTKVEPTAKQLESIERLPERTAQELGVPLVQLEQIRERVYSFLARKADDLRMDVLGPMMMNILVHRQDRHNRKQQQRPLFGNVESMAEPAAVEPDGKIVAGAQVQLWHRPGAHVPYLAGLETVADLATENVETFLQLAWQLVRLLETQAVRSDRPESLTVRQQHDALQKEAGHIIKAWSFPHATNVRKLSNAMAQVCIKRSLEPTAPLGGGANAIGIEQTDFADVVANRVLADTLFYGMAYSAFTLIPGRKAKDKLWTLVELSGPAIAFHGLTTQRGGFVPMKLQEFAALLKEDRS